MDVRALCFVVSLSLSAHYCAPRSTREPKATPRGPSSSLSAGRFAPPVSGSIQAWVFSSKKRADLGEEEMDAQGCRLAVAWRCRPEVAWRCRLAVAWRCRLAVA